MSVDPGPDRRRLADGASDTRTSSDRLSSLRTTNSQSWGAFFRSLLIRMVVALALVAVVFVVLTVLYK